MNWERERSQSVNMLIRWDWYQEPRLTTHVHVDLQVVRHLTRDEVHYVVLVAVSGKAS